jgi:hypothetical protein
VAATVLLDREGRLVGKPRPSKFPRVGILLTPEGAGPTSNDPARASGREGASTKWCPISVDGLRALRDDPEQRGIFVACALDFREFLRVWHFLDQETGTVRCLGDELWQSQEEYIRTAAEHPWLYSLKARQLGATSIAIGYDAWCARFRDNNSRVHVFSSGDDAAKEILEAVRFGLERLPESMRVPMHCTTRSIRLDFGGDERAYIRSYAATRAASRGSTCTHLHLDEWAAQVDPAKVYQSVAPSVAPRGSFHIVTTEVTGAESPTAGYYRRCQAGEGKHHALFCDALSRKGRDEAWLEGMRRSLGKAEMSREYPMTWEEALSSAGERLFVPEDLIACSDPDEQFGIHPSQAEYERHYAHIFNPHDGPRPRRRKYVCGWDIGLKQDATVGVLLDCTAEVMNVVGYVYLKGASVGEVERAIEQVHADWPDAIQVIEENSLGYAILSSVRVRESRLHGFTTTASSKPRLLGELQHLIELHLLRYPADTCPELHKELLGYRLPDTHIRQDTVMSLGIAVFNASLALNPTAGRILGVHRI